MEIVFFMYLRIESFYCHLWTKKPVIFHMILLSYDVIINNIYIIIKTVKSNVMNSLIKHVFIGIFF